MDGLEAAAFVRSMSNVGFGIDASDKTGSDFSMPAAGPKTGESPSFSGRTAITGIGAIGLGCTIGCVKPEEPEAPVATRLDDEWYDFSSKTSVQQSGSGE